MLALTLMMTIIITVPPKHKMCSLGRKVGVSPTRKLRFSVELHHRVSDFITNAQCALIPTRGHIFRSAVLTNVETGTKEEHATGARLKVLGESPVARRLVDLPGGLSSRSVAS